MATEPQVLAALMTACRTAAAPQSAYSTDELGRMDAKPDNYVEVGLSRRFGSLGRLDPAGDVVFWRATVRGVGATGGSVRTLLARLRAGLEARVLTVGSETSTPVAFEMGVAVGPDDLWWSGLDVWTFAL